MKSSLILTLVLAIQVLAGTALADTVLFIGDSLSYSTFGENFLTYLSRTGNTAHVYSVCGSSPYTWLNPSGYSTPCGYRYKSSSGARISTVHGHSPSLAQLLQQHQADTLIVQTGNNMYGSVQASGRNDNARNLIRRMKTIIFQNSNVKNCIWISPVYTTAYSFEKQIQLANLMEEELSPQCRVFKSAEITRAKFYGNGGSAPEHPSDRVYRGWSEIIFQSNMIP